MTREITRHGATRMQQRGISTRDIDLIMDYGTMERPGLHRLRDRDADREIRGCKLRIQALERLRGWAAVVEDGTLVTCFHVHGAEGRKAMRGRGQRYKGRRAGVGRD